MIRIIVTRLPDGIARVRSEDGTIDAEFPFDGQFASMLGEATEAQFMADVYVNAVNGFVTIAPINKVE